MQLNNQEGLLQGQKEQERSITVILGSNVVNGAYFVLPVIDSEHSSWNHRSISHFEMLQLSSASSVRNVGADAQLWSRSRSWVICGEE